MLKPTTSPELQQMVIEATTPLVMQGGNSKPALSTPPNGAQGISVKGLSGIITYDPGEYTFTAQAGTAVGPKELVKTLLKQIKLT